jgi:drug/metabolite transporter (DMT)-like permease
MCLGFVHVRRRVPFSAFDGLLLLMILIWGGNYTVVKAAFRELPYLAFNAARLLLASGLFVAIFMRQGLPRLTRSDWLQLAALGAVGHAAYQLLFMGGLSRTTVANSSLLVGCSPIAVSLASAWVGHERVSRAQWFGVALSGLGIYLVVGSSAGFGGAHLQGDALTLGAVACWAVYTVGSRALLARMSPLVVTGLTMALGTVMYVPFAAADMAATSWRNLSAGVWLGLGYSSLLSLNVAYVIWYTSVQRMGNVRTSAWSNLIPLVALASAAVFLDESLSGGKLLGAVAILGGVALTRAMTPARMDPPAEE